MRSNLQQQENGDLEENEEIEYEAHENEGEDDEEEGESTEEEI